MPKKAKFYRRTDGPTGPSRLQSRVHATKDMNVLVYNDTKKRTNQTSKAKTMKQQHSHLFLVGTSWLTKENVFHVFRRVSGIGEWNWSIWRSRYMTQCFLTQQVYNAVVRRGIWRSRAESAGRWHRAYPTAGIRRRGQILVWPRC